MRRKYYWTILFLLIIGFSIYWVIKTRQQGAQIKYTTAEVQRGDLVSVVSASGNIIVKDQQNIDPTITGTVQNLAVNVGEHVVAGQFLFDIVNDQLAVTSSQAFTDYKNAVTASEQANADEDAAEAKLITDKKSTTFSHSVRKADEMNINAAEFKEDSARQAVGSAWLNYKYAKEQADKRHVVSPITGTVNAININNGDDLGKLSSGSSRTVPMIIGDLATMKAQVQVNEVDIPNVHIGSRATMTFEAISNLTLTGTVEKMDSLGTLVQGVVTYNVTIGFDELNPLIRPQMSVAANISAGEKFGVLIVPNSAVKMQNMQAYVEVINAGESMPHRKNVQIGISNNTYTEIISGLNEGEKVVTQTINPNSTASNQSTGNVPGLGGGRGRVGG